MSSLVNTSNLFITISGFLIVMILGMGLAQLGRHLDFWSRRFFAGFWLCLILYEGGEVCSIGSMMYLGPGGAWLNRITIFAFSLFSGALLPMLTVLILHQSGGYTKKKALETYIAVCFLFYCAVLITAQFGTAIFYVTPDNEYYRGPWYPVLLLPSALMIMGNLILLLRRRRELPRAYQAAFLFYLLIPLLGTVIQQLFFGILAIPISTALCALYMFFFFLSDQVNRSQQQAEENARQRVSIKMLQMRPHFIYNTMTSIYYLCDQDPQKAQQVILAFSSYLRQNFTAISKEELVPFTEELEHARAYLAVEQARFGRQLSVDFDTSYTMFRLPPLTLQPIVENAVKHGRDPELEPLHICVHTRKTERGGEITVEDNGPGFVPTDEDRPQIALANIRDRLALMCRGTLTISRREGGGTAVTIFLPEPQGEN